MENFKCKSIRLCSYLYSLGLDRQSKFDKNNNEYWLFKKSDELQKALDFFFIMRKNTGANENKINRRTEETRI